WFGKQMSVRVKNEEARSSVGSPERARRVGRCQSVRCRAVQGLEAPRYAGNAFEMPDASRARNAKFDDCPKLNALTQKNFFVTTPARAARGAFSALRCCAA